MITLYTKLQSFLFSLRYRLGAQEGQPALEYIAIAVVVVAVIVGALAVFADDVREEVEGLFDEIFN